jgi:hypothetical protein
VTLQRLHTREARRDAPLAEARYSAASAFRVTPGQPSAHSSARAGTRCSRRARARIGVLRRGQIGRIRPFRASTDCLNPDCIKRRSCCYPRRDPRLPTGGRCGSLKPATASLLSRATASEIGLFEGSRSFYDRAKLLTERAPLDLLQIVGFSLQGRFQFAKAGDVAGFGDLKSALQARDANLHVAKRNRSCPFARTAE